MTTTTRPYPPPRMRYEKHITTTLPAWHENPLLKLRFDVSRMTIFDAIEYNGWRVTKSWTPSEGNLWRAYKDGAGVRVCTSAAQAVDVVTAADCGQDAINNQEGK